MQAAEQQSSERENDNMTSLERSRKGQAEIKMMPTSTNNGVPTARHSWQPPS